MTNNGIINNRFKIVKKIGEGRSKVFLCEDIDNFYNRVAIKILPAKADRNEVKQFRKEYFTLKKLNHPNICNVFETGKVITSEIDEIENESYFFTLEFFDGKELLNLKGIETEVVLSEVAKQICSVLYYLHQSNYIYYDLKPENILILVKDGRPFIKLIDLGLAQHIGEEPNGEMKGTAEYIAPEILKKEEHDHKVDFYSLGIMLYRIMYGRFPFSTDEQIQIYKSQIEDEFKFPENSYSDELNEVLKNLLFKDPDERYTNALQIISALNYEIDKDLTKHFVPASVFANRKDAFNILNKFIKDETVNEVFSVKGTEGAGKTTLTEYLYNTIHRVILIPENQIKSGINYFKDLLKKILYNDYVYYKISDELKKEINKFINKNVPEANEKLKSLFTRISLETNFVLILDGFNSYDDFVLEVYKDIIPILQVNSIKIILTENSENEYCSSFINNCREINLTSFTDTQLSEFLDKSFYKHFPKDELKKLINLYADLLPGNIKGFINDLILLEVIKYNGEGVKIDASGNTKELLESSQEEIYEVRVESLSQEEFNLARLLSVFDIPVSTNVIGAMFELSQNELYKLLEELQNKNIIQYLNVNPNPVFTSPGLKKFIYSYIDDKKSYHNLVGSKLKQNFLNFNKQEIARHFQVAGEYEKAYQVLLNEINSPEKKSAYSFHKKILRQLLSFPLQAELKKEINFRLAKVLIELGENKPALNLVDLLLDMKVEKDQKNELNFIKGKALIGIGDQQGGIQTLKQLIEEIGDKELLQKIVIEIAGAEIDSGNFDEAKNLCNDLLKNKSTNPANRAHCYNLLGLVEIYKSNNTEGAIEKFQSALDEYEKTPHKLRISRMHLNLGNIFSMIGNHKKADYHWKLSLNINLSIGNIEQEAKLLLNYGILYFDELKFEKAIKQYSRALNIFSSLGDLPGQGLVMINLGEVYYYSCEYQKSLNSLNKAVGILSSIKNYTEEAEALFMLGKLYFVIGDVDNLNRIIKKYSILIDKEELPEKHKTNLNYLNQLILILDESEVDINELLKIRDEYANLNEKLNLVDAAFNLVRELIRRNDYIKAYQELNNPEFIKYCESNALFKAEKIYLTGIVAQQEEDIKVNSPLEFYEKAYELMYDESITELTWKILITLAESYFERGIYKKAVEYLNYAKHLILHIAENFEETQLSDLYIQKLDRKNAVEKIDYMQEKI